MPDQEGFNMCLRMGMSRQQTPESRTDQDGAVAEGGDLATKPARLLYACVCMYVCMYVCIYMHVCMYVCMCV